MIRSVRRFSFDSTDLAKPAQIEADATLATTGFRLPAVLERLQSTEPERWEALNDEFGRCIPEFDRIVPDAHTDAGMKAIWLRSRITKRRFAADEISSGTLIALALLTLAYQPDPPAIICLEEPDHGNHPRLLEDVRDALYRLCYPDQFGESREPVQIIATTHSPYFLDLFRDRPEEIVIANKQGHEATFERLIDRPNYQQILGDAPLGEVWCSGILGGVPTHT